MPRKVPNYLHPFIYLDFAGLFSLYPVNLPDFPKTISCYLFHIGMKCFFGALCANGHGRCGFRVRLLRVG